MTIATSDRLYSPTFTRDVAATIAARLTIVAFGLLGSIVTARVLNPAGRGEYFVVVTFAQLVAQFGNLGLQSSNSYLAARERPLFDALLANSVWICLLVGLTSVVIAGVSELSGITWTRPQYVWLAALLAPMILFHLLGGNLLVGIRAIGPFNTIQVGSASLVLLCMLTAAWMRCGPTGFLVASTLGWSLCGVWLFAVLRRFSTGPLCFRLDVFKRGLSFAIKAYLATLLSFLVLRSNVFLIQKTWGAQEVGYYSVAAQMADLLAILPQCVSLVLFPTLVSTRHGRLPMTLRSLGGVGALLVLGCAGTALLAEPLIRIALGPSFLPASSMVQSMMPGVFFLGLTSVLSQYLAADEFPSALVAIWLSAVLLVIALSLVLIPAHGGIGAATALSLTQLSVFASIGWLGWRRSRGQRDRELATL